MCPWITTAARTVATMVPLFILVGYNAESSVTDMYTQWRRSNIGRTEEKSNKNIFEQRARMNFLRCAK